MGVSRASLIREGVASWHELYVLLFGQNGYVCLCCCMNINRTWVRYCCGGRA